MAFGRAMTEPSQPTPSLAPWDSEQYRAALARLDSLEHQVYKSPSTSAPSLVDRRSCLCSSLEVPALTYQQISSLRFAIPSLVTPLLRSDTTKAQAFMDIRKAAMSATQGTSKLKHDWSDERTTQILDRAKESEKKNPDLSLGREDAVFDEKVENDG